MLLLLSAAPGDLSTRKILIGNNSAVAVVTESGGPLSHGAVTAREMRIPAVMSVKGSLTRLQNGQRVRVDGTAGRIQLLG